MVHRNSPMLNRNVDFIEQLISYQFSSLYDFVQHFRTQLFTYLMKGTILILRICGSGGGELAKIGTFCYGEKEGRSVCLCQLWTLICNVLYICIFILRFPEDDTSNGVTKNQQNKYRISLPLSTSKSHK